MSLGAMPEDSPSVPAGSAEPVPRSARAERPLRLQRLAGMTVLGSDGRTVGRVRDIYQQDDSGELAAITVMPRQLSSRAVLIPAAAIAALPAPHSEGADDGAASGDTGARAAAGDSADDAPVARQADAVQLSLEAAVARAGLRPPATGHATAELLREAEAALGLASPAPEQGGRGCVEA